jgi:hypothetical protein
MPRMEHTTTTTGERRHVKGLTNLHPFKKLNPYAAKSAPMKKKKTLRNAGDVIKAYLADYAVHAEKTINGKGFGLFVMEDTTDKHVNYARRVLMHVANENTTDVEALLALLARTNMDSLIATIALNVQTGYTRSQYVGRCAAFMTYTGIDTKLWKPAVDKARAEANRLTRRQESLERAKHSFHYQRRLLLQTAADAAGTMGANPRSVADAIVRAAGGYVALDLRHKARARVHMELLNLLADKESIDIKKCNKILRLFVHLLSSTHLPQRPHTYVYLRFGVPPNPFLSPFQVDDAALEKPFWLTWNDERGCYGLSQLRNKTGFDAFQELAPEITPLVSSYLQKLAAGMCQSDAWGMPVYPKRDGTVYSYDGFDRWMEKYWLAVPEFAGVKASIQTNRHAVADYLASKGIVAQGDEASKQQLARSYAKGMCSSPKQLSGCEERMSHSDLGAYNKVESSMVGLPLMAQQHYRRTMYAASNGEIMIPDLRHTKSYHTATDRMNKSKNGSFGRKSENSSLGRKSENRGTPPTCFATALDLDPGTGDVLVVLMTEAADGAWVHDWKATYMVPDEVVSSCALRGMLSMVWDNDRAGWITGMNASMHDMQMRKATEATAAWFNNKGGHDAKTKQKILSEAHRAAASRMLAGYEGQVVLADGHVAEVRGLEKADEQFVYVLPYEHIRQVTATSSEWKLLATSHLLKARRTSVKPVAWSVHMTTMITTVFMAK